MAQKSSLKKSAHIHQFLKANPEASAREVVAALEKDGIKVSVRLVNHVKRRLWRRQQTTMWMQVRAAMGKMPVTASTTGEQGQEATIGHTRIPFGSLRLQLSGKWSVTEFATFLTRLHDAYAWINAFFLPLSDINASRLFTDLSQIPSNDETALSVFSRNLQPQANSLVSDAEQLRLSRIELHSPGWAEVIGSLNPLTVIKEYLVLVRDWSAERRKKQLENRKLELDNDQKQIENETKQLELQQKIEMHKLDIESKQFDNDMKRLVNEAKELENEMRKLEKEKLAIENLKAPIEIDKAKIELQLVAQKLIQEKLVSLEKANVSKETRKKFVTIAVLKPVEELAPFVLSDQVRRASIRRIPD